MNLTPLFDELAMHTGGDARTSALRLSPTETIHVYPRSIVRIGAAALFLARWGGTKYMYLIDERGPASLADAFSGQLVKTDRFNGSALVHRCPVTVANAEALRGILPSAAPVVLGVQSSFGFGDRLGLANPAHIRAVEETVFRPVFAQQSIRELTRTGREPEDVLAASTWAVMQEGYRDGYGADGDHLKTPADIDRFLRAGYTMYTFDPGEYVFLGAGQLSGDDLDRQVRSLPGEYGAFPEHLLDRYADRTVQISDSVMIAGDRTDVLRALAKYGRVIDHAALMYSHLQDRGGGRLFDVELSVDETDSPTTPFEHFFVASELRRRGVVLTSLAPRFVGDFEKGIEYRGDLAALTGEYARHAAIASALGPYKISVHSGSDKFAVYRAISGFPEFPVHIKTAGTSYLEALRTVASTDAPLFLDVLGFARDRFDEEKASYHVSATIERLPDLRTLQEKDLAQLLDDNDARQILHVTFGGVLSASGPDGRSQFRERILRALDEQEDVHYAYLIKHFRRHLDPFTAWKERAA